MKIVAAIVLTLILSSFLLVMHFRSGVAPSAPDDLSFIDRSEFSHRDDRDIARIILLRCHSVTTNRIFEGGAPSPGSWALTVLYREAEKNGVEVLIPFFNQAQNDAAKIYLLLAMYHLNQEKFDILNKKIGNPRVRIIDYCLVSKASYSELLERYSSKETFNSQLLLNPLPTFEKILEPNSCLAVP